MRAVNSLGFATLTKTNTVTLLTDLDCLLLNKYHIYDGVRNKIYIYRNET